MKLQTKLLLTLLSGVLLVTVASQLFQRQRNSSVISRLAQANLALEEKSQWAWVENLQRATQVSLLDAMALGDMDKFTRLLYAQREVQGLQEMTLYNADGVATYSTLTNRLRQKLPAELTEKLLRKTENVVRRTPESFELFRPSRVDKSCLECHNEFKEGTTGGVLAMRFTTDSLKEASHQWTGLVDTLASQSLWNMLLTTAVLCVVTAFMIAVAVRRQIAAPLNRITGFLTTSSDQLNGAAAAVAAASAELAGDASHQAASLEETSASLEEMASMTRGNVEHAAKVDALAREAAGTTEGGMKDMEALDQAMQAIQASGTQVAHIVRTIDEIAFQTNILALNAAVEAARAGEAGMGFAVVADEVRNLAQRSAKAAKETANQIEESISRGNLGAQLSVQVHAKLASILDQIRQVTAVASEVSSACREQDQGVQQINQAVEQMDRATQGTAAGAEESASASEELRAQASELTQAVNQLHQLINGNQRRPDPAEPTPKSVKPATSAPPAKGSKASLDTARQNGKGLVKVATLAEPHAAELRAGF